MLGSHRTFSHWRQANISALDVVVHTSETLVEASTLLLLTLSRAHFVSEEHYSPIGAGRTDSVHCFVGGHGAKRPGTSE